MARRTGWSIATMNDIYHGKTSYYREILNVAAQALNVAPFELLLSPDQAHALKRYEAAALTAAALTAADRKSVFRHEEPPTERRKAG